MKDFAKCCNCGKRLLVDCGKNTCPVCDTDGTLEWIDGEDQEVDEYYFDYSLIRK